MDENRYFRTIWRINGVAILLLVLFAIGAGVFTFIRDTLHRPPSPVIKNVAEDPLGEEKWTLGTPDEIDGTQFTYVPLLSERKDISVPPVGSIRAMKSRVGGYFNPSRNLLFINKQTREMKWLFKDNKQLIVHIDMLSALERYDKDRKVDTILYQVIRRDTNGDNKLTSDDLADISVSLPDGSNYKEVAESVERLFGAINVGGQDVLILYQVKGKGYASTIRLADMSVRDTKEFPKIEEKP